MIWIIGGTSEAVRLVEHLQNKKAVIVSVATEAAREFLPECRIRVGRMNLEEMEQFIRDHTIDTIVDASHPYATEVSENARTAAQITHTDYIRFTRDRAEIDDAIVLSSTEECLRFLETVTGSVFFTTGSNHMKLFDTVRKSNRFVYRVLPTPESMEQCRQCGIALKDIVAALGPFSLDLNLAMFREFKADYVVMKNSGQRGGTAEKLEACRQLKITPLIIERESESGYFDLDELIRDLLNR